MSGNASLTRLACSSESDLVPRGQVPAAESGVQNTLVQSAQRNYLSALPVELISMIFQHSAYSQPISISLLPHTRRNLYNVVEISSYRQLRLFVRTILSDAASSPDGTSLLGKLVNDVSIECKLEEDQKPQDKLERPSTSDILSLFRHLPRLRILHLGKSLFLLGIFLDPRSSLHLPVLNRLFINWPASSPPQILNPHTYIALNAFPNLLGLTVAIPPRPGADMEDIDWGNSNDSGFNDELEAFPSDIGLGSETSEEPTNSSIKCLLLRSVCGVTCAPFLGMFTNLVSLHYYYLTRNVGLILEMIPHLSKTIEDLLIIPVDIGGPSYRLSPLDSYSFYSNLALCTNLVLLHLDATLSTPSLLPTLQHLPLHFLRIDVFSDSTSTSLDLLSLLTEPSRFPQLAALELVGPIASFVEKFEYETLGDVFDFDKPLRNQVPPGWKLAEWPERFSFEDAKRVCEVAEERGIRVYGGMKEAVVIEQGWRKIVKTLERVQRRIQSAALVEG